MALNASLKDVVITDVGLETFMSGFAPIAAFARNFSPDAGFEGEVVKVPLYQAAGAAEDFDAAEGYGGSGYSTTNSLNATTISVTMSKHLTSQVTITDKQLATHKLDPEAIGRQLGYQLAKGAFQYVVSVVTDANFDGAGNEAVSGVSAANFGTDDLLTMSNALFANGVPAEDRVFILQDEYMTNLSADTKLSDASAFGSDEAIRNASVGHAMGFDFFQTSFITGSTPGSTQGLRGFAGSRDAIAVASKTIPVSEQGEMQGVVSFPMTHPETGLSFTYRVSYDSKLAQTTWAFDWLGGVSVGIPNGLDRVTAS